jgi:hypothetical protein
VIAAGRLRAVSLLLALCAASAAGCRSPDPQKELAISELETYWAVDPPVGGTQYLAPVVRFRLHNKGAQSRSIQATVTFRRKGEGGAWSSAWSQVSPVHGRPLASGQSLLVVLKPEGEGRYTSPGPPESMFTHRSFVDVTAELFLRVGSSTWSSFAKIDVPRRLGSQSVQGAGGST